MHEKYLVEVDELQKLIQEGSVSIIDTRSPEAFK
jgi:hypothetical protein